MNPAPLGVSVFNPCTALMLTILAYFTCMEYHLLHFRPQDFSFPSSPPCLGSSAFYPSSFYLFGCFLNRCIEISIQMAFTDMPQHHQVTWILQSFAFPVPPPWPSLSSLFSTHTPSIFRGSLPLPLLCSTFHIGEKPFDPVCFYSPVFRDSHIHVIDKREQHRLQNTHESDLPVPSSSDVTNSNKTVMVSKPASLFPLSTSHQTISQCDVCRVSFLSKAKILRAFLKSTLNNRTRDVFAALSVSLVSGNFFPLSLFSFLPPSFFSF